MKRIMIAVVVCILMAFFIVSCATTTKKSTLDLYAHITVESIQNCSPQKSWQISPFGLDGFIFVFQDCLKVNKLVVITVNNEAYTEEIRKDSVKLVELHYIYFMDYKKDSPEGNALATRTLKWSLKEVKKEVSGGWKTHFYVLSFTKAPKAQCSGPTCPRKKQ